MAGETVGYVADRGRWGFLETMELRSMDANNGYHNETSVAGIVADQIPLQALSCVELYVPSPDETTCVWMPFLPQR